MSDSTKVTCTECDHTATVSTSAVRSLEQMEDQLPIGWHVYLARREPDGDHVLVVYCPDHKENAPDYMQL